MSITKHTPGPWSQSHRLNRRGSYSTEIYDEKGEEIATVAWFPVKTEHGIGTNREANARLLAAAPEVTAELVRITDLFETWATDHSHERTAEIEAAIHCARAAIAKATGAA